VTVEGERDHAGEADVLDEGLSEEERERAGRAGLLYPTKVRLKLTLAVRDNPGRIYYAPAAKQAYDDQTGRKITFALDEQFWHGWLRPRKAGEPALGGEWSQNRIYYRVTPEGLAAIERGQR
jgi:hypothetical protein